MQMTNEFIKRGASSKSDIYDFLLELTQALELDYFLFAMFSPVSMIKTDVFTIDNYPEGWRELYEKDRVIQTDPIINYCAKKHSPILWEQIYSPELKAINALLFPTQQSGFAIPLHGPMGASGIFSLSVASEKHNSENILSEALTTVQVVLPYLQDATTEIRQQQERLKGQLTTREVECLTWGAEGKSAWEIAKILGCSERTVTFHLNNAVVKLGCTNRYQAIAKAILTGVITPTH